MIARLCQHLGNPLKPCTRGCRHQMRKNVISTHASWASLESFQRAGVGSIRRTIELGVLAVKQSKLLLWQHQVKLLLQAMGRRKRPLPSPSLQHADSTTLGVGREGIAEYCGRTKDIAPLLSLITSSQPIVRDIKFLHVVSGNYGSDRTWRKVRRTRDFRRFDFVIQNEEVRIFSLATRA